MDFAKHSTPLTSAQLPSEVTIYEVGPRDGLQNETRTLPTADKRALIESLIQSGLRHIEVTSFVSPRWIPQLADAEDLLKLLGPRDDVTFSALVPNLKGLQRARRAGLREVAVFLSASETHSQKNINRSIAAALTGAKDVVSAATDVDIRVRGYLSTVWGCPFEGSVEVGRVVEIAQQLVEAGVYQLSLGDTIGVGTPRQTAAILEAVGAKVPLNKIALHLHDTRGTALTNALVGLSMGIATFDASIGGLGGCPYAPGAAGNLATEDLLFMLQGMGIATGVSLDKLVEAGEVAQRLIGRKLPGKYLQAALGERERKSRQQRGQT